eukprot:CAMPEP_0171113252 /NCGR_PEP_ID=MMETSP0766_2-20121228/81748_1 /TAXON_ID=439317 /ORGANISM="Gambierdiscus australes, Strain CAWD 149" /LENGTH=53 /DNA_ID=CAMNT_0011575441 /DNA_START=39 /DNA_END=200 /DNA_ORIENTATION=+
MSLRMDMVDRAWCVGLKSITGIVKWQISAGKFLRKAKASTAPPAKENLPRRWH